MLKLFGAILIVTSSTAFGFAVKLRLSFHINELQNFLSCLDILGKEIHYSMSNISESLKNVLEYSGQYNGQFFSDIIYKIEKSEGTPISDIWFESANSLLDAPSVYEKDDIEAIKTFGNLLGCGDTDLQDENIDKLKKSLNKRIEDVTLKKEKLSIASKIGVYVGFVIVVILI